MSEAIRENVSAILERAGVTYSARYQGLRENALGGSHSMDTWMCTLTRGDKSANFDFYTGLGHRAPATANDKMRAALGFAGLTENDKKGRTSYGRRYLAEVEKLRKPKAPHVADLLYSVILDASASEMSFADWCAELDMDTDSRKALATYEACQQNADKLRRVVSGAVLAELREALQDY